VLARALGRVPHSVVQQARERALGPLTAPSEETTSRIRNFGSFCFMLPELSSTNMRSLGSAGFAASTEGGVSSSAGAGDGAKRNTAIRNRERKRPDRIMLSKAK
jgi:hypothetical protein